VASGDRPVTPTKQKKERGAIVKIPPKVLAKAQGLAIFTTARVGFQLSGATGSGILIARLPDGSWSPPSGIQVHAVGAGFMIGVDIYDCVCVINSKDALAAFMSTRVSLGPDVAVVAGPWGAGGTLDVGAGVGGSKKSEEAKAGEGATTAAAVDGAPPKQEVNQTAEDGKLKPDEKGHKRRSSSSALKPVFSYVKSRGFYAGVQVDGTVVTERKDANAAFYGQKLSVQQILRGEVPSHSAAANATHWPAGSKSLYDTLKIAEAQPATAEVHLPTAAQQQTAHVPGAVGVPLEKQDHPVPIHGSGAQMSGAAGTTGEQLPGYVHDGVVRPGVGDNKTTYQ
jgi:lipid-binding SYLF domain-containing protein